LGQEWRRGRKKGRERRALTDKIVESEEGANDLLVALHADPQLGSDALVDELEREQLGDGRGWLMSCQRAAGRREEPRWWDGHGHLLMGRWRRGGAHLSKSIEIQEKTRKAVGKCCCKTSQSLRRWVWYFFYLEASCSKDTVVFSFGL